MKITEGKGIKIELTKAELFAVDELVESEINRCILNLDKTKIKTYLTILNSLSKKLQNLINL